MNRSKISCLSLFIVMLCLMGPPAFSQSDLKQIVDSLAKYTQPIHHNGSAKLDYSPVIDLLKSKQLVSLGESTHGTKEIFDGKVEIIKGLIETGNFKTIFIETDYCGLLKMDTLIRLSTDTALYEHFIKSDLYSIYRTAEVFHLFSWVKAYNRTHAEKEKVSILGIDMQDASKIVKELLKAHSYIGKHNLTVYNSLLKIQQLYASDKPIVFSKDEQLANEAMLSDLKAMSGKAESLAFKYLVQLIDQSLTLISISDYFKRSDQRDKFMAENVLWMKTNMGNNGKAIVWAHNGHVAHVKAFNKVPMGYYFKRALNNEVYTLAFAFNEGMVRIKDIDPKYKGTYQQRYFDSSNHVKSIEYYFKNCQPQDFFLDFNRLHLSDFLTNAFKKVNYMRTIGTRFLGGGNNSFNPAPVFNGFDGIVFFNKTNAAVGL